MVSYTYDAIGRRQTMTVSGQGLTSYAYDVAGRVTQIMQGPLAVSFTHDAGGRPTSVTLPNGVVAQYGYDSASNLASIAYYAGEKMLGDLAYEYDGARRRNRVSGSLARVSLPEAIEAAAYDGNNHLLQWGSKTFTYDANGNMLTDGANSYTWDAWGKLASMNGATFAYDGLGRRVGKTISGTTTSYLYDGWNPVQEQRGAGFANLLTGGLDGYFARIAAGGATTFLTDALGSTVALADETGSLTTQYTYEPFGKTTVAGAATTNSFAFTGRELDETGLYYYRARYYDPALGRFISEDPVGFQGGSNFYVYAYNLPTVLIDPTGTCAKLKPNSRCAKVFANVLAPGMSPSAFADAFNRAAADVPIYTVRSPSSPAASLTDDAISGNGSSSLLGDRFFGILNPSDAFTITNGKHPAIVLGSGYFSSPLDSRVATLIHEEFHAVTGMGDAEVFAKFSSKGLPDKNFKQWPHPTAEFSDWIKAGCPE